MIFSGFRKVLAIATENMSPGAIEHNAAVVVGVYLESIQRMMTGLRL